MPTNTHTLAFRRAFMAGLAALAATPALASDRLNIIATTGMIADMARRIGGDAVSVRGLMGAGVDPHGYRQTRSDIVAMTRADATFWHGSYLEAQMEAFLEDLDRKRSVHAVADTLDRSLMISHADYEGRFDPHVWIDPSIWAKCSPAVVDGLAALFSEARARYEQNAAVFVQEAAALDVYARDTLAQVPLNSRILLTAHDALGYFGIAYDLEVLGIRGVSTDSEAVLNRNGLVHMALSVPPG